MSFTPSQVAEQFDAYAKAAKTAQKRALYHDEQYHLGKEQGYIHAAKFVREFMTLKWSKDFPTKPGTYWYRWAEMDDSHGPMFIHVILDNGVLKGCVSAGDDAYDPFRAFPDSAEWAGPLEAPTSP